MIYLLSDFIDAVKSLFHDRKLMLFTLPMLAATIGICLATASIVKIVFFDPLPVTRPSELVEIGHNTRERGVIFGAFSSDDFTDLQHQNRSLVSISSYMYSKGQSTANVALESGPRQFNVAYVDENYFSTLQAVPYIGSIRPVGAADRSSGVIVSWRAWRQLLGANTGAVGQSLRINDRIYRLMAVMPESFALPSDDVDAWLPLSSLTEEDVPHNREVRWLDAIGRLRPSTDIAGAQRDIDRVISRLALEFPSSNAKFSQAAVVPLSATMIGDGKLAIIALLASIALVAIAVLNLSGLMALRVARNTYRDAIKAAVGCSLGRIRMHYVWESALLMAGATMLAVPISFFIMRSVAIADFLDLPRRSEFSVDTNVLGLTVLIGLFAAIVSVILPILRLDSSRLGRLLVQGSVDSGSLSSALRSAIIVLQIVFLTALAYASVRLTLEVRRVIATDIGVQSDSVGTFKLTLQGNRYQSEETILRSRQQILDALAHVPGVISVAASKTAPIGETGEKYGVRPTRDGEWVTPAWGYIFVTRDYFSVLGVKLIHGKMFPDNLAPGAEIPLVVNEAFEKSYGYGKSLIDREVWTGLAGQGRIVGVVDDIRHLGPAEDVKPTVYVPFQLFGRYSANVLVKYRGNWTALLPQLRRAVWSVDPALPIMAESPLSGVIDHMTAARRFVSWMIACFCAVSILVVMVGIFSLSNAMFETRRRELLVRLALGASPSTILLLLNRNFLGAASFAVICGLPLGMLACRAVASSFPDAADFSSAVSAIVCVGVMIMCFFSSFPAMTAIIRLSPSELLRAQ